MVGLKPFCPDTLQCDTLWIMKNWILLMNPHSAPNQYTFFSRVLANIFQDKIHFNFFSNFKTAITWHCDNHFWSFFANFFFLSCILMTMIDFPETFYWRFWVASLRLKHAWWNCRWHMLAMENFPINFSYNRNSASHSDRIFSRNSWNFFFCTMMNDVYAHCWA